MQDRLSVTPPDVDTCEIENQGIKTKECSRARARLGLVQDGMGSSQLVHTARPRDCENDGMDLDRLKKLTAP